MAGLAARSVRARRRGGMVVAILCSFPSSIRNYCMSVVRPSRLAVARTSG
jgi:hypothetical protein